MPKGIYKHNKLSPITKLKISLIHRGKIPWNKGIPRTEEEKEKMRKANSNENCWRWLGFLVGYRGLHLWVKRHKGKAKICSTCGENKKRIHWSNIDHQYRRNLNDYVALCAKCHKKHDRSN